MKLLVVEDNVQSANLLVRLFESTGYEVVHKTHGLEGLKATREEDFDAVLLDFNLPDIDGSQIGLLLRSRFKYIPLIALTSQDDKVTRHKARIFGFDAFIAKPWNIKDLLNTVQALTNQKRNVERDKTITVVEHKLNTEEMIAATKR